MKIDFNQKIMNAKGDAPLPRLVLCPQCKNLFPETEKDNEYTLADAVSDALFTPEQGTSGEEKAKRGALAIRIARSKEPIDLEVKELALIQECVGKTKSPLIVVQVWQMLEGATPEVK